ncbi:MAG: protein translocase subunit SecD [Longimicrobiales bacterium]
MMKSLRGRIALIVILVIFSLWSLYRNQLKLGLDLQGGMHIVLEVDDPDGTLSDEARSQMIDQVERIIRTRIDEFGVEEPLVQKVGRDRVIVELPGVDDEGRAKDLIQQSAFLEFKLVRPVQDLEPALSRLDRQIVAALGEDSIRALGRAVEGPSNDVLDELFGDGAAQGDSADADTEEQGTTLAPFTSLLLTGDYEGTYLVAVQDVPVAEIFMALPQFKRALPRDIELHWDWEVIGIAASTYRRLYVLEDDAFVTGDMLENAVAQRNPQFNRPEVNFQLNRAGGRRFANFTAQHVGDYIAIVLDNEVVSAPVVNDRIGANGVIEMGTSSDIAEAADLALVLRAGALPVKLRIMEERTVGPSLGQDSIDQGELAGIIGLLLVVVIMIGYYRVAGVLAVFALAVYVTLVLGGLSAFDATLTLPGIGGLILSIGMAVDANVLIFERIREELNLGRATRTAVDEGFAHALSAIVDANITTLITAVILFQFGTGPVRGFAVTLSIGIIASFFSALYVTRTFFLIYLSGKKASDPISI